MPESISTLTAALLAQAAYKPTETPPPGWVNVGTFSSGEYLGLAAGSSSVTAYRNSETGVITLAFKGSDNVDNFKSDLGSSGGSAWASMQNGTVSNNPTTLSAWYSNLQRQYPSDTFITDGRCCMDTSGS